MSTKFDRNKSVFRDVYQRFSANDSIELNNIYMEADQKLMYAGGWDYKNPDLLTNKIVSQVEQVGVENVPDTRERYWISNMLWMWYHHAISCAIWRYKDKDAARRYAKKALELQPENHPNKITRLFYLLLHDKIDEAQDWAKNITTEPEKTTAQQILFEHKSGAFDV